uniref:Uncharacterized protein n=1 Tax=Nelumbo nucifera TaxID=4432 RepID=A0A822YBY1_NELNU|nr:TPA_asm: hypothetical protein HUJ06_029982 [Nelumbo nucifera]
MNQFSTFKNFDTYSFLLQEFAYQYNLCILPFEYKYIISINQSYPYSQMTFSARIQENKVGVPFAKGEYHDREVLGKLEDHDQVRMKGVSRCF